MARNEEKSHSVLNRWLALQTGELGKKKAKRPHLASLVDSLDEAERWRRDCLKDIGVKVMQIQNGSLSVSGSPGLRELKLGLRSTRSTRPWAWTHFLVGILFRKSISYHNLSLLSTESLDEFRVRDLNDEINRLLREKTHWERRIRELGGPDYAVRLFFPT